MDSNLKKQLQDLVDNQTRKYPGLYKRYSCSSEEVFTFFYKAAEMLTGKGVGKPVVVSVIRRSIGNYLLGRKYGVTPEGFAHGVWRYSLGLKEEDYEKENQ